MKNEKIQKKYWRRAKLAAFIAQLTPFIRMIGLNGSLARHEARVDSDIDFLIIASPGQIWTCRFFSICLMAVFGLKRYKNKIAGRVCLNLYQTQDHLKLTCRSEYLAKNYAYTLPLWQRGQVFSEFVTQNSWIEEYGEVFHYKNFQLNLFERVVSFILSLIRGVVEIILLILFVGWGEKLLKKYQLNRINIDPRTINSKPGEIYMSEKELRFHPFKE